MGVIGMIFIGHRIKATLMLYIEFTLKNDCPATEAGQQFIQLE
jgi:hypothetical protein